MKNDPTDPPLRRNGSRGQGVGQRVKKMIRLGMTGF